MSRVKYTQEFLSSIVADSISVAQVLHKLGLQPTGGNYSHIQKKIKEYNIDRSHFKGQSWNKGSKRGPKRPITDYLSNKFSIKSNELKHRLLNEGYFTKQCQSCQQSKWKDKDIPLELHHIDCNHANNDLSNLMILCPNCHAQEHET